MPIQQFYRTLTKKYGKSSAVHEQIEELRSSLELKAAEYREWGLTALQAQQEAVKNIGDVRELFETITDEKIHIKQVFLCASALSTLIVAGLCLLECLLLYRFLRLPPPDLHNFIFICIITTGVGISTPLVVFFAEFAANKFATASIHIQSGIRTALLGWVLITLPFFAVNMLVSPANPWSLCLGVGLLDWPITSALMGIVKKWRFFRVPL